MQNASGTAILQYTSIEQTEAPTIAAMEEWGLSPSSEEDRKKFIDITRDIQENADEVRRVQWLFDKETGKRTVEVNAYIKGNDVVLVSDDGEYITTIKDGINNARVKGGGKIEP